MTPHSLSRREGEREGLRLTPGLHRDAPAEAQGARRGVIRAVERATEAGGGVLSAAPRVERHGAGAARAVDLFGEGEKAGRRGGGVDVNADEVELGAARAAREADEVASVARAPFDGVGGPDGALGGGDLRALVGAGDDPRPLDGCADVVLRAAIGGGGVRDGCVRDGHVLGRGVQRGGVRHGGVRASRVGGLDVGAAASGEGGEEKGSATRRPNGVVQGVPPARWYRARPVGKRGKEPVRSVALRRVDVVVDARVGDLAGVVGMSSSCLRSVRATPFFAIARTPDPAA